MNLFDLLKNTYPSCYPDCSCEPAVTGLILQPWAFWTSLFYLPCAYFIYLKFGITNRNRNWYAAVGTVVVGSLFAHARFDLFSLALDEAAVVFFIISFHLPQRRSWGSAILLCVSVVGFFQLCFILLPVNVWVWVVSFIFAVAGFKAVGYSKKFNFLNSHFYIGLVIYGLSFLCYAFDKLPFLCDSRYVPYLHPVWHFGSAVAAAFFASWWFAGTKDLDSSL